MSQDNSPQLRVIEGGGNLIAFIEAILVRAKEGKLRTLAIAELHENSQVATGVAWGPQKTEKYFPTLGAIEQLKYDLLSGEIKFPN